MPVPNTFASATSAIPLANLDTNFATPITLGNTAVQLGNTITTINSVTLVTPTINTITSGSGSNLVLQSNNAVTAVTIDTNQNMGLGATPPSVYSLYTYFQIGNQGFISSGTTSNSSLEISNNLYRYPSTANFTYLNSYAGTFYSQYQGQHRWYYAPSGTAGTTATTTQAMTLDNSGNLNVSSASNPGYGVYINRNLASFYGLGIQNNTNNTGNTFVAFINYLGNNAGSITQSSATGVLYNITSDRRLKSNITSVTSADSGPIIDALLPRKFTWNADGSTAMGFITDEYQNQFPNAITGQPNETKEEEYEVTPAVKDEQGNITTPAVMGTRTVPVYQMGDFSTSEFMAVLVAEIQSLRARLKAANIA